MKTFLITAVAGMFFTAVAEVKCQMLLPEKEQKRILFGRWYPRGSKLRLSAAAARDGYAALDKNDLDTAMREFNRAWRFNQKNIDAYWGAAIVMGLQSENNRTDAEAKKLIGNSLRLLKIAEKYLSGNVIEKENWQFDYAASLYTAGKIHLATDRTAAEKYFLDAEKLWLPLSQKRDMKKKRDFQVYYRACWHLTQLYRDWGKQELYEKYLNILPAELQKKL